LPGGKDVRKSPKTTLGVPDVVVEDDDGSGNQVFPDWPADIPDRRAHRIVRVGAAEDAGITALASQFDLPWPCKSAWGAEELQPFNAAEWAFGLFQVANKLGVRVAKGRSVPDVMVSNLVPSSLDPGDYVGVAQHSFADEKKSGLGILPLEDL
jgi:hypothetical protein